MHSAIDVHIDDLLVHGLIGVSTRDFTVAAIACILRMLSPRISLGSNLNTLLDRVLFTHLLRIHLLHGVFIAYMRISGDTTTSLERDKATKSIFEVYI